MPAALAKRWAAAKKSFEAMTHQKKPKEKLAGFFKSSHTGLSGSIDGYDKAFDAAEKAKTDLFNKKITLEAALKALNAAKAKEAAFVTAKGTYLKTLATEIKKETDKEADVKSVWERGLKFLQKELESYEAIMDQACAQVALSLDDSKKDLDTAGKQVALWKQNMVSAIKKGQAAAAKFKTLAASLAKAPPDKVKAAVKEYNTGIPGGAGRDICMQLVIAERVDGLRGQPDKIKQQMIVWNTPNTHKLDENTATADDLMTKVKAFSVDVKATQEWYSMATTR
jgi:hypothetical protein